jgi:alpha-galactosidase
MLFSDTTLIPEHVRVECGPETLALEPGKDGRWAAHGIRVDATLDADSLAIRLTSPSSAVTKVILSWGIDAPPGTRILNDHWERGYGDLEWRGVVGERCLPWYFLAHDGRRTCAYGVKTQPNAMCFWTVKATKIELTCDVRCGRHGVELGSRCLDIARVVALTSEDISPFELAQDFCRAMCPNALVPAKPIYGFNDWYYAYGRSTRQTIISDAATLAELAPSGDNAPFCVIDAGWQVCGSACGGPWDRGNVLFRDMPGLAEQMRGFGVRPGVWIRLLRSHERLADHWLRGKDRDGWLLDPSIPDVLEHIAMDVRRVTGEWGYELMKHDFSTNDILGNWGFEMGSGITCDRTIEFRDRSRTTAEIILAFYRAIRAAAGDAIILGCNTISHLSAGLVDVQRTGDDTSGREWERTRKMGINTLAFRMPQHGALYAVDADCVGLTTAIPWSLNRQWLDLLARSGTPLFVSASPDALGDEQMQALREAFQRAAGEQPVAEPLDWFDTTTPRRWQCGDDIVDYDWSAD